MGKGSGKELKITVMFTAAFLFGGFIHVALDKWDLTDCIAQVYYSILVLTWAISIRYRIVDRKVRQLILMTAALYLLSFFLQMLRYRIFEHFETAKRYFWYGYYVPILLVPLLFLFVVLRLDLEENERVNRLWLLTLIPSVIFILLVMTNDIHQKIFVFSSAREGVYGTYTHGLMFYFIYAWVILVFAFALFTAVKKCRIPSVGNKLWMPLYFSAYGVLSVCNMFDIPKVNGINVWFFIECLAMVTIGMEEACIQLGLIPSNSGYHTVFRLADKPVVISDINGTAVYSSGSAREMFTRGYPVQVHTQPVRGGSVSWAIDLTEITELNRGIENATESIRSRNEYLRTENALKEEQAGLKARNALYNKVAHIVTPQLEAIKAILHREDGAVSDADLARIAVLDAYIKRRSNMELLKADEEFFPAQELASAIRESCEYLKLCGVTAALNETPESALSAESQICLYEAFEAVIESCLDSLRFLLINVAVRSERTVMRIAMNTALSDNFSLPDGRVLFSFETADDETAVTLTVTEGGGRI